MIRLRSPQVQSIPVIGLHTPQQTAALQEATGMLVTIGRNGARLVQRTNFKGLLDAYNLVDVESHLSDVGALGDAA